MKIIEEFKAFALRGNALDLAIGVVIGAAFGAVTTSLVNNVITPPLGLLIGGVNFSDLVLPLGGSASIQYGLFIQTIISFLITAAALFLLVKALNTFMRKAKEEPTPAAAKSDELLVLEEIRDTLKKS